MNHRLFYRNLLKLFDFALGHFVFLNHCVNKKNRCFKHLKLYECENKLINQIKTGHDDSKLKKINPLLKNYILTKN